MTGEDGFLGSNFRSYRMKIVLRNSDLPVDKYKLKSWEVSRIVSHDRHQEKFHSLPFTLYGALGLHSYYNSFAVVVGYFSSLVYDMVIEGNLVIAFLI